MLFNGNGIKLRVLAYVGEICAPLIQEDKVDVVQKLSKNFQYFDLYNKVSSQVDCH